MEIAVLEKSKLCWIDRNWDWNDLANLFSEFQH